MSLWSKLFGGGSTRRAEAEPAAAAPAAVAADPWDQVTWVEPDAHASGLRCLDCRVPAALPLDPATVPEQAERFALLREDDGRLLARARPEDALSLPASLQLPVPSAETRDGTLFAAKSLEDKWDVFLFEGWLYFRRSWSGQLIYRASLRTDGTRAFVETVQAPGEAASSDAAFCVREVDYLVKSHLYGLEVPHPLPAELQGSDRELAEFSVQRHGRRACWASYGDTTAHDPWASPGR